VLNVKAIDEDAFFPVLDDNKKDDQTGVKAAYAQVYTDMDSKNALARNQDTRADTKNSWIKSKFEMEPLTENVLGNLVDAQKAQTTASLDRNNRSVRDNSEKSKTTATTWIDSRLVQLKTDIEALQKQLTSAQASVTSSTPPLLPVVNAQGMVITGDELMADPSKSLSFRNHSCYAKYDGGTHIS
jgi:hypothetical protein